MSWKKLVIISIMIFLIPGEVLAMDKPWPDWPDTDIEAGWYVKNNKIFEGYPDGLFYPNQLITGHQFNNVMQRAGINGRVDDKSKQITIAETQKIMPDTAWTAKPEDNTTRYRTAVMVYRFNNNIPRPGSDKEIAIKLNKLFNDKPVTYQGVTRRSRLIGHEQTLVQAAREHNVPLWLALGQCWRESQWFTTGLSITYNCGWGIKDSKGKWGKLGNPPTVKGYSNYATIDEAILAYFRLMDSPNMPYRALIDKYLATGDMNYIYKALDTYAPASENDTNEHHKIVKIVKGWVEERGIK